MTRTPEDRELLQLVQVQLQSCGVPAVANVALEDSHLMPYERRLAVTVEMHELREDKANAHVISWLANSAAPDGKDRLNACVFGYGATHSEAMSEAAEVWLNLVGAPVLSCLAARPLLGADHFEGHEVWGVPGGHGFVGPFLARGQGEQIDLKTLAERTAFRYEAYPRDVRSHIAKVNPGQS